MKQYVLAIDQGTTGSTALLIDHQLRILARATVEFPQYFPKPGWVEHDLDEIWKSVVTAVEKVTGNLDKSTICTIGITNQRETTCLWSPDKEATPLAKAIVWQDRRTADTCAKLKKRGLEKKIRRKTGLLLDPYFSGTKLQWLLENVSGAKKKANEGKAKFGTIDSYLLYRMSGEHKTEPSNACRTLLMDLKKCQWDKDLLKLFGIPVSILPDIHPSSVEYGKIKNFAGLPDGLPITGIAGDQQAALFGQACFKPGMAKCTYGTGAFILANTGHNIKYSKHRLLTSVAWQIGKKPTYCLEGSAFIAGASVQWLRDGLRIIEDAPSVESLAKTVTDSGGVVFVPALSGLGAPHWIANATGLMTGITRGTTKGHIARATLEGIAFQVKELVDAMGKDLGKKVKPLKVDGGASANGFLMQFQADLLDTEIVRSKIVETTALGAALQAGLAVGFWSDQKEIEEKWVASKRFQSKISAKDRTRELKRWNNALKAVKLMAGFAK